MDSLTNKAFDSEVYERAITVTVIVKILRSKSSGRLILRNNDIKDNTSNSVAQNENWSGKNVVVLQNVRLKHSNG